MNARIKSPIIGLLIVGAMMGSTPWVRSQEKPPTPLPQSDLTEQGELTRPIVRLELAVLETVPEQADNMQKLLDEFFPRVAGGRIAYSLGSLAPNQGATLISQLQSRGLAKVISVPKIMTRSGLQASIRIEKETGGDLGSISDRVKMPPAIGLTVECMPQVLPNGEELQVDLRVTHSAVDEDQMVQVDGVDHATINRRSMDTAVQVKSRQTMVLHWAIDRGLLIAITPTINPPVAAKIAADAASPARSTFKGTIESLKKVQDALAEAAPQALQEISLQGDRIKIAAKLDSADSLDKVTHALGKLDGLELDSIGFSTEKHGFHLEGVVRQTKFVRPIPVAPAAPVRMPASRPSLEKTLRDLFPDAEINVTTLNSSVLLRGEVDSRTLPIIVSVAEDYYPKVINDLVVTNDSAVRSASPPAGSVAEELRQLRQEILQLRSDVAGISEALQGDRNIRSNKVGNQLPSSLAPSRSVNQTIRVSDPRRESNHAWELTMDEVMSIARQNRKASKTGEPSAERQDEAVRRAFDELRQARQAAAASSADSNLQENPYAGLTIKKPLGQRMQQTQQRHFDLKVLKSEHALRELMGLEPSDGRKIVPVAP